MTPFRTASTTFPSSLITLDSIVSFQTYFPVIIHNDYASNAFEPIIFFYKSFANYTANFLFWSKVSLQQLQSTLNVINPSEGLSYFGADSYKNNFTNMLVSPCL